MKRRITFLLAALLLMSGLTRAQSDYSTDYTGNITLSTTGGTSASACKVVINGSQYDGIKAGTGNVAGAMKITVPANTKYLHMHVAAWNNNHVSLAVTPAGYSDAIALTANSGILNNSPFTFNGDPSTSDYYKVITFASALGTDAELTFTATGGKRFVIWGVTSEEDGAGPSVAMPTFDPANGTTFGNEGLSVTISCATAGASVYYTLDGSTPDDESTLYGGPISLTTTTTIKAVAYDANDNTSIVATATYTYVDPTAPGTLNNPYTVAQARAAIDAGIGVTGVYAIGVVSEIVTAYNDQHSNITFNMVDNEGDEDFLQAFRCTGSLAPEVVVGDVAIVYGNLIYYQNTGVYEFNSGCQLVSLTHTGTYVEMPIFSPEAGTYSEAQTVTITCATEGTTIYYTTDGSEPDDESTEYTGPITVSETTTIKAIAYDSEDNNSAVATATYTIQLPATVLTFNKIEGHNPVEGQIYMIVDLNTNAALTSANGSSSLPGVVAMNITNDQITTDNTDLQWTFEAVEGGYIIHSVSDDTKWLYTTDVNNGVRVGTNDNKVWTLNVTDATNTSYLGFLNNATSRYLGVYNNQDWRAYGTVNNNIKDTQIALFVNGEAPAPTPSFTIENNNEIAYDATSGSFNFTVNHPEEGGTTTVTEDVDWISNASISGNNVTFTTTVNEEGTARHGVITLTYTYNRAIVTKDVTVTQAGNPGVTMTIAEVRAQGTGSVVTVGVVTSITGSSNKTAYIQDATAAIVVYGNFAATVGDEIRVAGNLSDYNCLLEITNPEVTILSQGNTVSPEVMTVAEINESTNQGWYIRVENATVTIIDGQNTTIAQGDNTIVVRGIASDVTYAVNDILTLNGNIGCFNGAQIANPQNVVVQENEEPTITVTPATINAPFTGAEGTLTITYENIPDLISFDYYFCDANGGELEDTDPNYPDWIYAEINEENDAYVLSYIIDANQGEARTAYMKVYTFDDELEEVYAIVTVNQSAYEAPHVTWDLSIDETATATTSEMTWTSNYATMGVAKASATTNTNNYYPGTPGQSYTSTRFYKNSELTLSPAAGYAITSVVFTATTTSYASALTNSEWTNANAEVDGTTVTVTPTDGTIGIVATIGGTCGFTSVAVYYEGNTAPSINITPDNFSLDANAHMAETLTHITYQNIAIVTGSGNESFDVQYYDAEGQEIEQTWCVVGAVALSNGDGNEFDLTIFADANQDNEARTVYFKLYGHDADDNVVYSNLVTVTQAAPVIDYAVLPFVWEGGASVDFLALNGVTAYNLGSDYAASNAPYLIKFDGTGDYIQVKCDQQPGKVTIGVKMIGGGSTSTITIQGSADGETFTDIEELTISGEQNDVLTLETTNVFGENDRYVRMLFTKGSNVGVGPITIEKGNAPSITVTPATLDLEAAGQMGGTGYQMQQLNVTYHNLEIEEDSDFTVQFYDAQGQEQTQPDWIMNTVGVSTLAGNVITLIIGPNEGPARSTYFKVSAMDNEDNVVYSNLVTINQAGVVQQYTLTVEPFDNLEIFTFIDDELTEPMEGAGTIQVTEGVNVMLSVSALEGYVMQSLMVDGVEHVNDIAEDLTYTFVMPGHNVTVSATAIADVPFTGSTYSLATSIESGRHYIITNGTDKAMGQQNNNNRAAVAITVVDGVAQVSSPDVYEFVINSFGLCDTITESYLYTIYDASAPGYLYAASSGSNYLRTREFNVDANSLWTITFSEESNAVITARGNNSRNLLRYNSGSDIFASYGSGQQPVYLFVKDEEVPQYDFYKDIVGHGEDENNWRLIATPTTDNADPDAVGMVTEDGAYDLYGYDSQAEGEEWQNYKIEGTEVQENGLGFGKGYLFASQNNVTLHFQGTPNLVTEQEIELQYAAGANSWNLIGNPLNNVARIEGDFYVMNADGDEIVLSERNEVYPMEGIFVKATEEGQSVMFYDYEAGKGIEVGPGDDELMKLSVSDENGSSDVACIRFGEGQGLEKFQLNSKHTKLYFTRDNTDYAVVRSTNKGEMPINFKAAKNGNYTLSVNVESVEMEYLHLIDNLTGADIDLLSTAGYSFDATTSDNAARFTLVFVAR